jgi:hypothetical protein
MTAQEADRLIENGTRAMLFNNPLEGYFITHERPPFQVNRTSNWRGYVATWEIIDQELFIISISGFLPGQKEVRLADIFPGKEPPILAHWVSGQLRSARGECLQYVHMGYCSTYERDEFLTVDEGRIVDRRIEDNRNKKLISFPF